MKKVLNVCLILASLYWVINSVIYFIRDVASGGGKINDVEWISRLALGMAMMLYLVPDRTDKKQ